VHHRALPEGPCAIYCIRVLADDLRAAEEREHGKANQKLGRSFYDWLASTVNDTRVLLHIILLPGRCPDTERFQDRAPSLHSTPPSSRTGRRRPCSISPGPCPTNQQPDVATAPYVGDFLTIIIIRSNLRNQGSKSQPDRARPPSWHRCQPPDRRTIYSKLPAANQAFLLKDQRLEFAQGESSAHLRGAAFSRTADGEIGDPGWEPWRNSRH